VIRSFRCRETERIFNDQTSSAFPANIQRTARRKLRELHAAPSLNALQKTPGNRLEALKGNRRGQYSIRINDRVPTEWVVRICFTWDGGAHQVEIVDYH
jgi:toxin HigB-1